MLIQENVPLAPLTTLQVGGHARFFVEASTVAEVRSALEYARGKHLPVFILGGGSNLVIADSGWPGLVLKVGMRGIDQRSNEGKRIFEVGAGDTWDDFVATAVAQNCAGVE